MWIDNANNFEDLSFADDIMMPSVVSDSNRSRTGERVKSRSRFGKNVSKVGLVGDGKMGLFTGAYRNPNEVSNSNLLAYTMIKGLLIDLGPGDSDTHFSTTDVHFIGNVLTVTAFLELPSTIGVARDNMKPIPAWKFSTQVGDFDCNDNGDGNTVFNGLINCKLNDEESYDEFFDKLEHCLLLQAVSPRRYIIRKEDKNYTNSGLAAKIILTLNEVLSSHR